MEQQLKQRLVGVAVIFFLAVIFLPMLLDGSGSHPQHIDISIPPPPSIDNGFVLDEKVIELQQQVAELPELQPLIVDELSDPVDEKTEVEQPASKPAPEVAQSPEPVKQSPPAPVVTSKPESVSDDSVKQPVGGISWVIQVGSFSDKNKAYAQRDRLRQSKLASVFIEKYEHQGALSYRVRMGPFLTREKANVVSNKVLAKYNIKGLVMRYEK